jgi:tetratricopeptide (TPR) repeat protein
VTITKHANEAAKAYAKQDYATARYEYRQAIGLSPTTIEFYYGLYDTCVHSGEWSEVTFALEKIFELDPAKKKQLGAQYGEALYHCKRYEEAIPVLKQALKDADLPQPKLTMTVPIPSAPVETQAKPTPAPAPQTIASADTTGQAPVQVAVGTNNAVAATTPLINKEPVAPLNVNEGALGGFSKSFENACHSECIVIAEYKGYEDNGDIAFNHPPKANYHITKILKGPPLNKDLPIRYEFHDRAKCELPSGWKFGADKMPEKGSQWIIFIQNAVPRERMFDTFQGAYGRQPATDENLNKVYGLLEASSNR